MFFAVCLIFSLLGVYDFYARRSLCSSNERQSERVRKSKRGSVVNKSTKIVFFSLYNLLHTFTQVYNEIINIIFICTAVKISCVHIRCCGDIHLTSVANFTQVHVSYYKKIVLLMPWVENRNFNSMLNFTLRKHNTHSHSHTHIVHIHAAHTHACVKCTSEENIYILSKNRNDHEKFIQCIVNVAILLCSL